MANLMLQYKPSARKYPGDKIMRSSTQQSLGQGVVSKISGPGRPRKDSKRVEVMTERLGYSRGLEEGNPGE